MTPERHDAALGDLLTRFHAGDRSALSRAISIIEDEAPGARELMQSLLPTRPTCLRVGLTGPPGVGKSTLVRALAAAFRERGERVGIVAVDPTSPYSGGALLGDRVRMGELATDRDVFIRSMATRSALGGLATTTLEVVDLLEAFGFDRVVVESVGVGQTDMEITGVADTVVVTLSPESGDVVQAMKAGLMEIADVFVVNKSDRSGADEVVRALGQALGLRGSRGAAAEWNPPVLRVVATSGDGVDALLEALDSHRTWLVESGEAQHRRERRIRARIRDLVEQEFRRRVWSDRGVRTLMESGVEDAVRGQGTPYSVAMRILDACRDQPS